VGCVVHDRVVEPSADQACRDLRKRERRSSGSAQAECRTHAAPVAVDRDLGRGRDHREKSPWRTEIFSEGGTRASPGPRRPIDFLEAFIGSRGSQHRAGEELFGLERAHALRRSQQHARTEHLRGERQFGARVGVREASANRAAFRVCT